MNPLMESPKKETSELHTVGKTSPETTTCQSYLPKFVHSLRFFSRIRCAYLRVLILQPGLAHRKFCLLMGSAGEVAWNTISTEQVQKGSSACIQVAKQRPETQKTYIVTDIHLETVLEIFFWRQVLFSFLSAVPSRYLSFLSVDPDCYNPIQHLEMVFTT